MFSGLREGQYNLCMRQYGFTSYQIVVGQEILIIPPPSITPTAGAVGTVTDVKLSTCTSRKCAVAGDYVVLKPNNCSSAESTSSGKAALGKTPLSLNVSFGTNLQMTENSLLAVCYATKETAEMDTDFVFAGWFLQYSTKVDTTRLVFGSGPQNVIVSHLPPQSSAWYSKICAVNDVNATSEFQADAITGVANVSVAKGTPVGTYQLCIFDLSLVGKVSINGVVSFRAMDLKVIAVPIFSPLFGDPGSITSLTFTGAAPGDYVAMRKGDCSGAETTAVASLVIESNGGDSSLNIVSDGASSDASLAMSVKDGGNSKIILQEGNNMIEIRSDGSTHLFAIGNGVKDVLTIEPKTGNTVINGDMLIGGLNSAGSRNLTVFSPDDAAVIQVESTGGFHDASISVTAPEGRASRLILSEKGGHSYSILNDATMDKLVIRDETHDLFFVDPTTGDVTVRGDLTVGGSQTGSRSATVRSTDSSASMVVSSDKGSAQLTVQAGLLHDAVISVIVQTGADARLDLTQGNSTMSLMHDGTTDKFVVRSDGNIDLMTIAYSSGASTIRGNLTVGGQTLSGARSMTVKSVDSAANFAIEAPYPSS